jgi:hypothetical protein
MIQSFASTIVKGEVGNEWVTRFIHRNEDHLITKWTSGMDRNRHEADLGWKYKRYFNLLHTTMDRYNILPENTYNMDEKGFMMGSVGKSKRVFSRQMWEKGQVKVTLQDGSRTWVSVLAYVGADGTALPPSIIFEALHATLGTLGWKILKRISIKSLSHHLLVDGAMIKLGLHGSPKCLKGIQRRKQGGLGGCLFLLIYPPIQLTACSHLMW